MYVLYNVHHEPWSRNIEIFKFHTEAKALDLGQFAALWQTPSLMGALACR